jgi:hypothetical protein
MVGGAVALSLIGGPFTPQPLIDARAVPAWWFLSPNAELLCLANGIPEEAAVSSYFFHGLTHRHELYRWPRPFRPIPAGESASPYLEQPDAALAAGVDYVIRPRNDLGPVLAGFVPEALTPHFERLRRESTTVANAPSCAGHDDGFS